MTSPTTVVVGRSVLASDAGQQPAKAARMVITPEGSTLSILVPFAPREVEHDDLGGLYATIDRPGLPPATFFLNPKTRTQSFSLFVSDRTTNGVTVTSSALITSAMAIVQTLDNVAKAGTRVRVTYGMYESGLWYINGLSMTSVTRDPVTDEIIQANVSVNMIKAQDIIEGSGPVTGGVKPPSPQTPPPPPQQQPASRFYGPVKPGDTLWAISIKFYGTGTRWRDIANANGISDPRRLRVGVTLRIPF